MLFSFTRSYFHVDLAHVGEVVKFLKTILPKQAASASCSRCSAAPSRARPSATGSSSGHLQQSDDAFVLAPGERGLVMICFTLPSFDVVFKLIRDKFPYQKNILREDVLTKYELVFKHDRAGRLVDAQEFKRSSSRRPASRPSCSRNCSTEAARHGARSRATTSSSTTCTSSDA